jgi:UDP:flavonoid glycosyltransferase YjiC (YdhE family)
MLRILFTFAGGSGHFEPLVPIARAAEGAGHTVAFVGRPWMTPQIEALGFAAFAAGSDVGLTPHRIPLAAIDVEREMRDVGEGFGRRIARERAAEVLALCAAWQPDLLVCEELDFGPMIVAERLGLSCATVLISATGAFVRPDVVAGPLNEVRAEHGLPPDPELAMPGRCLVLSPFPPRYRDPGAPLPATAHTLRLLARDATSDEATSSEAAPSEAAPSEAAPSEAAPAWLAHLGDVPTVYVTLGTIFNMESGDLFQRVLAGLRELPIELIVTVGRDIDPAELGPQPANVHVERYVPQATLLPHCHLVVSHGGSGSVLGALTHGLPMVLLPLGADQPLNAARCETLGVARALDAVGATALMVREAASRVLDDPAYRRAAEGFRDEIEALPGPRHAVTLLERLAAERRQR